MICPGCGAPDCELEKVEQLNDGLNQHGRREIVFRAITRTILNFDNALKIWHCSNCGITFTDKEGINGCLTIKQESKQSS